MSVGLRQSSIYIIIYFFFRGNEGIELNIASLDKLIKKEIELNSFNYIGKKYFRGKIIIENDVIILFALFWKANSFQYIDELGYYYFFDKWFNYKYNIWIK